MKTVSRFILLSATVLLSACTVVAPYERNLLSKPGMALNTDPMESSIKEHIYFAKEGSSSGSAVTGGGCGCN